LEKYKILIAEDNTELSIIIQNQLDKLGYEITGIAATGIETINIVKKKMPDIILMDIQMPVMDGIQATRLIRDYEKKNKLKKSVIIAVTAHTKEGEKQNLLDAGMNLYMSKPFKTSDLTEMLDNLKLS